MDELDHKILDLLRKNARMSFSEIGNAVGISRVSVKKRMTAMENAGIIRGYHAVTDEEQIRKGIRYTIDIEAIPEEYGEVVKALRKDRELEEIYSTTGECRIHCIGRSVNPSTMESKLVSGLYFAGEIIDIDAYTGGYNLQAAWSTGHLAGISAVN